MSDEMITVRVGDHETKPMTFDQIYFAYLMGYGDILTLAEFTAMCEARGGFAPHGSYENDWVKFIILDDTILISYTIGESK